jgi:hypothetical protein
MRRSFSLAALATIGLVAAGAVGWADDPPPVAPPAPPPRPMRDPTGGRPVPAQAPTVVVAPPVLTPPVLRALVQVRGQEPSALIEVGGRMLRIVQGAQFRHPESGGAMRVTRLASDGVVIEDAQTLEKVTLR